LTVCPHAEQRRTGTLAPPPAYSRWEPRSGAPQRGHGRGGGRSAPVRTPRRCTIADLLHRHLPRLARGV